MTKRLWTVLLVGAMALASVGCGGDEEGSASTGTTAQAADDTVDGPVLVFAAASLTDAFGEMKTSFEADNPGAEVQLNFAGSSALREQILEGAPADVFASANGSNMDAVVEADQVSGKPDAFVTNSLQIAVPPKNPGKVKGLADFANEELLIGLCADAVPCGDFGREALANADVKASVDTNEPDVRALLTKVGADELDAGIVYVTDVKAAGDDVLGIDIPKADNVVATYPIAALAEAPNPEGAAAFTKFVLSEQGQAILADFGFGAP